MAKKSTRGKIRDRIDYSELLQNLRAKDTEVPIQEEKPKPEPEPQKPSVETDKRFLRMLSDEKVLYFYHQAKNTIHEKHCELVKKIPVEDLTPLPAYKNGRKQCPNCALQSYLRIGAEDYKKDKAYDRLFKKMKADIKFIRKIFVEIKFKTRLTDASTIRIQYGDEAWKMKLLDNTGHISLSHNDYRLHYDGTREKYHTYHIQNERCERTTIEKATKVITRYKSHRPLSDYTKREQQVIKILKKNPKEPQIKIAEKLGVSLSTVSRTVQSLKKSKTLKRIGGKRYGYWKITM